MVGLKNKKPLYTVVVTPRETTSINGGNLPQTPQTQPIKQQMKQSVIVKDMTVEQLIKSYKINGDEDDEPLLPGFRYLKNMKTQLKTERVKSVLKKR
jgi:hypothetical protein